MITINDVLPNGALCLGYIPLCLAPFGGIVLARKPISSPFERAEYATWQVNDQGDTFWGHYFKSYQDAAVDFLQRGSVILSAE
jgi:hypothetical protein